MEEYNLEGEKPQFCVFFKVKFVFEGWKRIPVCRNTGEGSESPSVPHCTEGLMKDWPQWPERNSCNPTGLDYALLIYQDCQQRIATAPFHGSAVVWLWPHIPPTRGTSPYWVPDSSAACARTLHRWASGCHASLLHGVADNLESLAQLSFSASPQSNPGKAGAILGWV